MGGRRPAPGDEPRHLRAVEREGVARGQLVRDQHDGAVRLPLPGKPPSAAERRKQPAGHVADIRRAFADVGVPERLELRREGLPRTAHRRLRRRAPVELPLDFPGEIRVVEQQRMDFKDLRLRLTGGFDRPLPQAAQLPPDGVGGRTASARLLPRAFSGYFLLHRGGRGM